MIPAFCFLPAIQKYSCRSRAGKDNFRGKSGNNLQKTQIKHTQCDDYQMFIFIFK